MRVRELLPLLQHINCGTGPNAEAEFGQGEQGFTHFDLFPQHVQKSVLLLTGEPDIHHRAREQQRRGLNLLTCGNSIKLGRSPPGSNPLPDINFIRQTRSHKIAVGIRRAREAAPVQVHRFPVNRMETRSARAEIDLGQLLSPRNPGLGLGLGEPGPGLPQLEVLGKEALHRRVQPGVAELPPPLTQDLLACRPMMIRLRDRNRGLLQRTYRIRATAGDDK